MRNLIATALLVATCAGAASGAEQSQVPVSAPEASAFAGTWTLDLARSGATDAERRVITPLADSIHVEMHRAGDDRPPMLIYKFDGSETVNPFGSGTAASKLRSEGGTLVTETVYTVNGQPVTVHEVLRVNPDRTELTVDAMVRVEHGYQGVQPAGSETPPNVSKATKIFRRQAAPPTSGAP